MHKFSLHMNNPRFLHLSQVIIYYLQYGQFINYSDKQNSHKTCLNLHIITGCSTY
jgi:hypothetical protein